jgi:hypothetical protein
MSYADCTTKVARIDYIKRAIAHSDKWMLGALTTLYAYQTSDEQQDRSASHLNGCGFNKYDAVFLSSLAERVNKGLTLTEKQKDFARKLLPKYAGQLERIAQQRSLA